MQALIDGFYKFKSEVYPKERHLFRDLANGQKPHTLFITCADSRIVPNLITQTGPGELFICRTVGNQVPAHGASPDGSVASSIEYALRVLNVKNIVVCGHSDCGAMKAVLHPETLEALPATQAWLRNAAAARSVVLENHKDISDEILLHLLAEENVLAQIANLKTHPVVAARLARGELEISGWVYHIHSGEIASYDASRNAFVPLSHAIKPAYESRKLAMVEEGAA